jgi:glycosyltransferase involved in cell wall biosynthesis
VKSKLLFLVTEDWFFCSHFVERAVAARDAGYDVLVVARERAHGDRIRAAGLRLVPLEFVRRSLNPLREFRLLLAIWKIYKEERPDIVHHVAAKPILYGSLAARLVGVGAIVNAPVGMGYAFSSTDRSARLLRPLLRVGYRLLMNPRGSRVIFENNDDLESFVATNSVRRAEAVLIRGAGIDLDLFCPKPEPVGVLVVVLIARMLRDKGVAEFVAAARKLHDQGISGRFALVGDPDPGNPASIPSATLNAWSGQYGVEWWGWRDDVVAVLSEASIACLPSYREGLPKSLLEAAACGLPIVTTDAAGCRDVVLDGDNGLLVPVRDVDALAEALKKLLLNPVLRHRMGERSRARAVKEFSSGQVVRETLAVYAQLISSQFAAPSSMNIVRNDP